jgi:tetratricopeptide (TPR) repeat protein
MAPGFARDPKSGDPLPLTGAAFRPIVTGWQRSVNAVLCLVLLAVLATLTCRQSQMYARAETLYRMTIHRNPDCWLAHNNLGANLFRQERFEEAIAHYQEAIRIKPDYFDAHYNMGVALDEQGKVPEAIAHWREAARLQPTMIAKLDHSAWLQATCPVASVRNGAAAVIVAQRVVAISGGKEPELLDTLAAAYAEVGRFADAVRVAQKAVQLAESTGQKPLADGIRARLKLYRVGQPYREIPTSRAAPVNGN